MGSSYFGFCHAISGGDFQIIVILLIPKPFIAKPQIILAQDVPTER